MKNNLKIAIDGPSAGGKGTLARALAEEIGLVYADTGALYRAVGLYILRKGCDPYDAAAVEPFLREIEVKLEHAGGEQLVLLCGEDVSEKIRENEVSRYASAVSAHPAVREFLLDIQRSIAEAGGVVMDGRDIGTVIMPGADVKIFLTADPQIRAERRWKELVAKGQDISLEKVASDMKSRDEADSKRGVAPALPAPDAIILDNSSLTPPETIARALAIVRDAGRGREEAQTFWKKFDKNF